MVALPGQLFYSTSIAVCLWLLTRNKHKGKFRDRRGETLFIDARRMGVSVERTQLQLTDEDIRKISDTYHAWSGAKSRYKYADVSGFCRAVSLDEIRKHDHVLAPNRYVGTEAPIEDEEELGQKLKRLSATLREQQGEARKLDAKISDNLKELGYGE
jgi:type I restriction enzyme M protein